MKVKDVFVEYSHMVSFPWSPGKIKKAGYNPTVWLIEFGKKLGQCEDAYTPTAKELLDTLKQLEILS